jgi:hypothetical protein
MSQRVPFRRPLIAAALLLGLASAAHAQSAPLPSARGEGPRLSAAQRQKMFPETRALAVRDHQARIAILEKGLRCLTAASGGDALRACMRQERQALDAQRSRHREALRQAFVRQGIPVPDWSQRQGRRSAGPEGAPQGWDHPGQPGFPLPGPQYKP